MGQMNVILLAIIFSISECVVIDADDTQSELSGRGPVLAPIRHQKHYRGERELFGYNPRFTPNVVTFDLKNRPYIRADGVIQTLDDNGQWVKLDFKEAVKAKFPNWDGKFASGAFAEERIVFDSNGDAYMLVDATRSSLRRCLLLHSRDCCRTWEVYDLGVTEFVRLEYQDGHNQLTRPPVILVFQPNRKLLQMIAPTKNADGTLSIPKPILISNDSLLVPNHSGGGNSTVTRGNLTHIVWPGATPKPDHEGTPQYAATYDHHTSKLSQPVLIGFGGYGKPDPHNIPAISLDSKGYLHVVMGAHHDLFKYTRSLKPESTTSGWTKPIAIGTPKTKPREGSYTYIALICDQNDTLHLVARWAGDGYYFRLVYLRKKDGQPWEKHKYLVVPFRPFYSCWYHKLNIDRKGRLFLNYIYYGNQLGDDDLVAYRKKWPDEEISLAPGSRKRHGWWNGVQPHDPAILMSDDGGDRWRLATTKDFADGV